MSPNSVLGPIRKTKAGTGASNAETYGAVSYSDLLKTVKAAGLLERQRGFYFVTLAILSLALIGLSVGFFLLGNSWFQLLIAAALGIVLTQFAFIAHEASHRQIFTSGPINDSLGRFLSSGVVGMSYSWWMNKHSRHHTHPNTVGKDPDIEIDTISFQEKDAAKQKGFLALLTRRQGSLFFPLLMLEGINLHYLSIKYLVTTKKVPGRWVELTMIAVRFALYLTAIFWVLPLGLAAAFLGVQLAVFGVYMGASFAPNHKGMPMIQEGETVDFLTRQVRTSRNISGGFGMTMFMGGLNHQVEHHLFPNMPRLNLQKAKEMVKKYCQEKQIPYTETTLFDSYRIVIEYLNRVGLSARNPFDCPVANDYRRR